MDYRITWFFELDYITDFMDCMDFVCFCNISPNRIDGTMTLQWNAHVRVYRPAGRAWPARNLQATAWGPKKNGARPRVSK